MKKDVTFESADESLAGHLYLPDGYRKGDRLPGIVVTGAWTTVKEQMPATYAAALAQRGYAALTFDFRGWGESGGEERFLEHPIRKSEDVVAAARFLASRDEIDSTRVGGLGICASSGYMVKAFIDSEDLKTIALAAAWLHDPGIALEVYGGEESVRGLIETSRAAEVRFDETGELSTIVAASTTDADALMYQAPYYTEPDRGLIREYDNQFNLASWEPWLTFDAISLARQLPGPIRIVHSEAAVIPHGAKQFANHGGSYVDMIWLDGITQFEFYDQPEPLRLAADAVAEHFKSPL